MAESDYDPQTFDGQSLTASPFSKVGFHIDASDVGSRPMAAVGAAVVGRGTQDVRAQPKPAIWELRCSLVDSLEATLLSFRKIFSEDRGLCYLVANDGDGNAYRIACRVIDTVRLAGLKTYYAVKLRVPNPRLGGEQRRHR